MAKVKRNKQRKKICAEYDCNNIAVVECKYCKRQFCLRHIRQILPQVGRGPMRYVSSEGIKMNERMNMGLSYRLWTEWKQMTTIEREDGHPCPEYAEWWLKKRQAKQEKVLAEAKIALDSLRPSYSQTELPDARRQKRYNPKIQIPSKISNIEKLGIVVWLALIFAEFTILRDGSIGPVISFEVGVVLIIPALILYRAYMWNKKVSIIFMVLILIFGLLYDLFVPITMSASINLSHGATYIANLSSGYGNATLFGLYSSSGPACEVYAVLFTQNQYKYILKNPNANVSQYGHVWASPFVNNGIVSTELIPGNYTFVIFNANETNEGCNVTINLDLSTPLNRLIYG